jgi:hypothetical protein
MQPRPMAETDRPCVPRLRLSICILLLYRMTLSCPCGIIGIVVSGCPSISWFAWILAVIGKGLVLTLAGIAIGLASSIALTRMMSAMLYETSAADPSVFVGSAIAFVAVALIASYVPARRATRIDPTRRWRGRAAEWAP